jgi:glycosyltransferase involved in cell wall biosynthesis
MDKYDLVELATYGEQNDPRGLSLPWKYVPVNPDWNNPSEKARFESDPVNQFGQWKFEETCLAHRATVVLDYRDPWSMSFEESSCFRPFYNLIWMPTIDAAPLDDNWVASYLGADQVFGYTDWGVELMRSYGIPAIGAAPPGADFETYQVIQDKAAHKERLGLKPDILVVGTVMRNQVRKLYPDLLDSFALFLKTAPAELAHKTYLYLHTAWPDLGWDIPKLICDSGLSHKVLMTYFCKSCHAIYPGFFQDCVAVCKVCGRPEAGFPRTNLGVSRAQLNQIYNVFDTYVQLATCEGFGMPIVEAAACGIPLMVVDYSGMCDSVAKLGATPIRVQRFFRDSTTSRKLALPDNEDLVQKLIGLLSLPEAVRRSRGFAARKSAEEAFSWDKTAKVWADAIDRAKPRASWDMPSREHRPPNEVPPGLSNDDFIRWGLTYVAGRPELISSYTHLCMLRELNWGQSFSRVAAPWHNDNSGQSGSVSTPFGRQEAMRLFLVMNENQNVWEARRVNGKLA